MTQSTNPRAAMQSDKQGRPYARLNDLQPGDTVTVDGDYTCLAPWSQHQVETDERGLFICCEEGHHYLDGQLDDAGEHLIGMYPGVLQQKE